MDDDRPRYAIYYAPAEDDPLWRFGCRWLGRDATSGEALELPEIEGIEPARLAEITAEPRLYGFHATLKAPFHAIEGVGWQAVQEAAAAFARERKPFRAPPLVLRPLDGFLALRPVTESPDLAWLAADTVRYFDFLRGPLGDEWDEPGLNPRQEALRRRWGYPYVMDEFRFHMTLTRRLEAEERQRIAAAIQPLVAPLLGEPLSVEGIALFVQDGAGTPFHLRARHPFGN